MGDFNELSFDVEVSEKSYSTTISHLNNIIERLEKIQKLQGGGGNGSSKSTAGSKKGFEYFSKTGKLNKADTKHSKTRGNYNAYNELQKQIAKETEIDHIWSTQIATLTQLNKAKQQKTNYDIISNDTNVRSENVAAKLNDEKYIEQRRIELANQARAKEIDQRLKNELGINKNTKSLGAYIAKLTSVVAVARRLGQFISGVMQESSNYIENLNLFATAYGETYEETLDWALNLADSFGLASNEVIKFAGTFRELSSSLGLISEQADTVSQYVTQLGYDLSALFNTTVEEAMEKLQSGIFSGNVRPLRAFGIDISQNQIDALFETNEALAQLGVNARNLSQSDKVIARLIIALQSGSDAFGTMNREINNLQSQFRIFQGSLSNFKLAIGDLVNKPLSDAMVYINGFIIAITKIIRAFVPLKDEDKTLIGNLGEETEETSEALENLNGQLATFDKFNVLGGSSDNSNLAVTEALNNLLKEQTDLYDKYLTEALEDYNNLAVSVSKSIIGWFVKVDEEGNIILKDDMPVWTGNAKILGAAITSLAVILASKGVVSIANFVGSLFTLKNALSLVNTALIGGILYSIIKAVEAFNEGDTATGALAVAIGTVLAGAFIALQIAQQKASFSQKSYTKAVIEHTAALKENTAALTKNATQMNTTANSASLAAKSNNSLGLSFNYVAGTITAMYAAYSLADTIINSFDGEARKTASGLMILVGAIMAVTAAILAMNTTISWGTALPVLLAGVSAAIAGVKGLTSEVENIAGYADGGYTNANLIMTHENGKREWVGKAAGSSAIVNDTQMSDIMEMAVAKGVYQAMSARSAMGGNTPTNETIVVKIGEEAVFNAVRKTARRQGKDFSNV